MDPQAIKELLKIGKEELLDATNLDVFNETTNSEAEQCGEVESVDEEITGLPPFCK
jgi:hypothetical protein